jgi:hypothetical protein
VIRCQVLKMIIVVMVAKEHSLCLYALVHLFDPAQNRHTILLHQARLAVNVMLVVVKVAQQLQSELFPLLRLEDLIQRVGAQILFYTERAALKLERQGLVSQLCPASLNIVCEDERELLVDVKIGVVDPKVEEAVLGQIGFA